MHSPIVLVKASLIWKNITCCGDIQTRSTKFGETNEEKNEKPRFRPILRGLRGITGG